mmetsp:Transcript_100219/g.287931  ORF Transcript_100219/g.287931 Transcript_100219/m.287931 type:complete len:158 (-) Transcript_100219:46-519(-)
MAIRRPSCGAAPSRSSTAASLCMHASATSCPSPSASSQDICRRPRASSSPMCRTASGPFFQGRQNIGIMRDASMTNGLGPGNYGLGWLGAFNKLKPEPKLRTRKLNSEIANGRLAMFAIMGLLFQNGTFGTTGPEMWFVQFPEYGNTVGDFIPKNLA